MSDDHHGASAGSCQPSLTADIRQRSCEAERPRPLAEHARLFRLTAELMGRERDRADRGCCKPRQADENGAAAIAGALWPEPSNRRAQTRFGVGRWKRMLG